MVTRGKNLSQRFIDTVVSMNGVVVLDVLSRIAVGVSNIAVSLSNSLGCAIDFLLWLSIKQ